MCGISTRLLSKKRLCSYLNSWTVHLTKCLKLDSRLYFEQLDIKAFCQWSLCATVSCRAEEDGGCGCQAIRDSAATSKRRSEGRNGRFVGEGY